MSKNVRDAFAFVCKVFYLHLFQTNKTETESTHLRDWHLYCSAVFWHCGTTCMLEETGLLPISEKNKKNNEKVVTCSFVWAKAINISCHR